MTRSSAPAPRSALSCCPGAGPRMRWTAFLASRGLEDAVVGALRGEHRIFGLLAVGGRTSDVSTFAEEDLSLFETFGGHAAVLLENGRLERSLAQVTELKEELSHQAYHDALTRLPTGCCSPSWWPTPSPGPSRRAPSTRCSTSTSTGSSW